MRSIGLFFLLCGFYAPIFVFAQPYQVSQKNIPYTLGNATVNIQVYESEKRNGIVYFNMHDNENTSVEAALAIIKQYGGTVVALQHTGQRLIQFHFEGVAYAFDPNRIFTTVGIRATLQRYSQYSAQAEILIQKMADYIVDEFLLKHNQIVAIHNNGNSASYAIYCYYKGGVFERDAADVFYNTTWGTGDFFYTTDLQTFNFCKSKQISAVLQNDATVTDDGSLAVFASQKGIFYINSEAEHGHLKQQIFMLEQLQSYLQP
ncbi:MAG: hypothetical protein EAZ55_14095 [Cytophagales bacterium]|nr:MAG: hypothetical protein EAZ55_14095 [Cytophagales bacterium]